MLFWLPMIRSACDVRVVAGAGLAVGGPMAYADSLGLDVVLQQIRELEASQGEFWKPAAGLVKRAEAGEKFIG